MTTPITTVCRFCKGKPADGEDQYCSRCRAELASRYLTVSLTEDLELFFDER